MTIFLHLKGDKKSSNGQNTAKLKIYLKSLEKKRHILTAIINIGNFEAVVILMRLACK